MNTEKRMIVKESIGWSVENCLFVFKTISDAQAYIDKIHSGCNRKEPVIIGEIELDKENNLSVVLR